MAVLSRPDHMRVRVVAKKASRESGAQVIDGAFVLTSKQYDHFAKWMKSPESKEPTPTLRAGAELLRKLHPKR